MGCDYSMYLGLFLKNVDTLKWDSYIASYFKQMIEGMKIYEKQCLTLSLTCGDFFPTVYIIVKFWKEVQEKAV